jgi:16S rRNA (cytosine967-C5)-methyltransferase
LGNKPTVRFLAVSILKDVFPEGKLNALLADALSEHADLSKQDRALLTNIVYGTVQHLITIDFIISKFSNLRVDKMKPAIRAILRVSVYQIVYLSKIPDFAICDEAVEIAKQCGMKALTGFVNGILRNMLRQKDTLAEVPDSLADITRRSIANSMPEWIIKDFDSRFTSHNTDRILKSFNADKAFTIRINTSRANSIDVCSVLRESGVVVEPHPLMENVLVLTHVDSIASLYGYKEGLWNASDVSSCLAVKAMGVSKDCTVLDLCAAPGGKSAYAADLGAVVTGCDISKSKLAQMKEYFGRAKLPVRLMLSDARRYIKDFEEQYDIVLADLPCSGLGAMHKKPDIRYKMTQQKQIELAKLQKEMLRNACHYVKPGGVLVYSTCTVSKRENEENLIFLVEKCDMALESIEQFLPEGWQTGIFTTNPETAKRGYLQILPSEDADGFFIGRVRKG